MADEATPATDLSALRIAKGRKRGRRGRGRWFWPVIILLAAIGAGVYIYARMHAPLQVKTTPVEVEMTVAGQGPAILTATGYVVPRHLVEVSSKIVGRIKETFVKQGDKVKEGDILIKLDDEEYVAKVQAAQAQLEAAKARLAELKAGSRPQEVKAAEALVQSAEATLANARAEYNRLDALDKQGAVSKQDLDRARAARDVAEARLDAERKNAELVKIGPRRETIEAAEAQLHQAEAQLEGAQTELGYTVIRAPITGTILEKLAEQGELVTNMNFGGTRGAKNSVVTMADLNDLRVEVDLNESEVSKVHPGQAAEIRLDTNPQKAYAGKVDEVSPQADRQKGTVQAKVALLNPDEAIKTEVNARVTFFGEPEPSSKGGPRLWAPKAAVITRDNKKVVFVIENGKAVEKTVKTGIEGEKGVEITEGLTGNESVITEPLDKVKNGMPVEPAEK